MNGAGYGLHPGRTGQAGQIASERGIAATKSPHATKGFYLPLRGSKTMDTLYEQGIAPLPKSENSSRLFQRYHERFHWPLASAMVLLILEMFLPDRKRRRQPRRGRRPAGHRGARWKPAAVLLLLALPCCRAGRGGPSQALREYQQGKYRGRAQGLQSVARKEEGRSAAAFQRRRGGVSKPAIGRGGQTIQRRRWHRPICSCSSAPITIWATPFTGWASRFPDPTKKQEAWENSHRSNSTTR